MIPGMVWWIAAALTFIGTVLIALGAAWGKTWPGRAFDFAGMMIGAWGIAIALICGLIRAIAWWFP
jgi:hypothetical protein